MRKSRFTENERIAIIPEADRNGVSAIAKRRKLSGRTTYTWRKWLHDIRQADTGFR